MSTESESVIKPRPGRRINGAIVVVGVLVGVIYLLIGLARGEPKSGLIGLAIMMLFTAVLVVGARFSDTIALLADDVHEERHVHIHQKAALVTINILAAVLVIALVADVVAGGDGMPYAWLAAVAIVVYFGTIMLLSRRN